MDQMNMAAVEALQTFLPKAKKAKPVVGKKAGMVTFVTKTGQKVSFARPMKAKAVPKAETAMANMEVSKKDSSSGMVDPVVAQVLAKAGVAFVHPVKVATLNTVLRTIVQAGKKGKGEAPKVLAAWKAVMIQQGLKVRDRVLARIINAL